MDPIEENIERTRREFLNSTASGLGMAALGSMLTGSGFFNSARADETAGKDVASVTPMSMKQPHFAPKAKSCIFIFLEGAPSQMDLYDPKPKLNELHGQKMPESM